MGGQLLAPPAWAAPAPGATLRAKPPTEAATADALAAGLEESRRRWTVAQRRNILDGLTALRQKILKQLRSHHGSNPDNQLAAVVIGRSPTAKRLQQFQEMVVKMYNASPMAYDYVKKAVEKLGLTLTEDWGLLAGEPTAPAARRDRAGAEEAWEAVQASLRYGLDPEWATESVSGIRLLLTKQGALSPEMRVAAQRVANLYGYAYVRNLLARWAEQGQPKTQLRLAFARDSRQSGQWIEPELIRGALAAARDAGVPIEIADLEVAPKPVFLEYIRRGLFDGGINVTASHNDMLPVGPEEYNGWEFSTGAAEPPGSSLQGGALLGTTTAAAVIQEVHEILGDRRQLRAVWRTVLAVGDAEIVQARQLADAARRRRRRAAREAYWAYAVRSLQENFGIDVQGIPQLVVQARASGRVGKTVLLFDSNGGSAYDPAGEEAGDYYPFLWDRAGIPVAVVNPTMTQKPLPEGTANLSTLVEAMQRRGALVGIKGDADADRGTAAKSQGRGRPAVVPDAQHGATSLVGMAIVLALKADPIRKIAVVVNDASSLRIYDVLKALGLPARRVKVVEVGEANLVEEKQSWERKGYWTIAAELSNGGVIFPEGLCRDAWFLGTLQVYLALDPQPFVTWLRWSGQSRQRAYRGRMRAMAQGGYTPFDIDRSFPWAGHPSPRWQRRTTGVDDPHGRVKIPEEVLAALDARGLKPSALDPSAVKTEMIRLFRARWPALRRQLGYRRHRILHTRGRRTTRDIPSGGKGGLRFLLDRTDGVREQAFVRGSGTEAGVMRTLGDVVGSEARLHALETVIHQLYTDAVQTVTARLAGLEEQPIPAAELQDVVPLDQVNVIYPWGQPVQLRNQAAVAIFLAAGRASRFERSIPPDRRAEFAVTDVDGAPVIENDQMVTMPKVVAPLAGRPACAWPIGAAQALGLPVVVVVGYQQECVMRTLTQAVGEEVTYVVQPPTEGTGAAFWRALAAGGLREAQDTFVIATAGDHLYDANLFRRALEKAKEESTKPDGADLILGSVVFSPQTDGQGRTKAYGKGRIVRARGDGVPLRARPILGTIEQADINAIIGDSTKMPDAFRQAGYTTGEELDGILECTMSLYVARAKAIGDALATATNDNAQKQYYATEIIRGARKIEVVDIPVWQAMDVTYFDDLGAAEQMLADHAHKLRWTVGFEEFRLAPEAAQGKAVVIAPEAAPWAEQIVAGLSQIAPPEGPAIPVWIADGETRARLEQLMIGDPLRYPGVRLLSPEAAEAKAVGTCPIRALNDLPRVGKFLGLLPAAIPEWVGRIQAGAEEPTAWAA